MRTAAYKFIGNALMSKRPAMDGLRARVQTDTLSGDGTFKERAGLLDGVGRGSASEH